MSKTAKRHTTNPRRTLEPCFWKKAGAFSSFAANVLVLSSCRRSAFIGRRSVMRRRGQSKRTNLSVVSGQLSVVSGQLSVVSCQWSVVSWHLLVVAVIDDEDAVSGS